MPGTAKTRSGALKWGWTKSFKLGERPCSTAKAERSFAFMERGRQAALECVRASAAFHTQAAKTARLRPGRGWMDALWRHKKDDFFGLIDLD
jgi:hypothetical protein